MTPHARLSLCLVITAAFALAGCKTTPKKADLDENGKPIEYVYVTELGSHLPKKVRKDQAQTSETASERTQDAMQSMTRGGGRAAPGN